MLGAVEAFGGIVAVGRAVGGAAAVVGAADAVDEAARIVGGVDVGRGTVKALGLVADEPTEGVDIGGVRRRAGDLHRGGHGAAAGTGGEAGLTVDAVAPVIGGGGGPLGAHFTGLAPKAVVAPLGGQAVSVGAALRDTEARVPAVGSGMAQRVGGADGEASGTVIAGAGGARGNRGSSVTASDGGGDPVADAVVVVFFSQVQ